MTDPSDIKINSINEFINKMDDSIDRIDLNILKERFELDSKDDETGFYKLFFSEKITLSKDLKSTQTYNRPAIGPIENFTYCSQCQQIGPRDHLETCMIPEERSLYLTLEGFVKYIVNTTEYSGKYSDIRKSHLEGKLTQEQLNQILLLKDSTSVSNGKTPENQTKTGITYISVIKKRGPDKLAPKTATRQFLNNVIISYQKYGNRSSIRVSRNGLINIINTPSDENHRKDLISTLVDRINKSGSVIGQGYEIKPFPYSYIHSASGQFLMWKDSKYEINYEKLNGLISPYSNGKIIPGRYTSVEDVTSSDGTNQVIVLEGLRIIEWDYIFGRETRQQTTSKEYIKFVAIPKDGIKISVLIHKHGSFQMTLSYCSKEHTAKNLCTENFNAEINPVDFNLIKNIFDRIFRENMPLLTTERITFEKQEEFDKMGNTVSGYDTIKQMEKKSTHVCRPVRTNAGVKESVRPVPYSWKGSCQDPNYQRIMPMGVKGTDGLYYPCCSKKTDDSKKKNPEEPTMRDYLINGFPINMNEKELYNTKFYNEHGPDPGSGILIPGSYTQGSYSMVKLPGTDYYQQVKIIKKTSKRDNTYTVETGKKELVIVSGNDFLRDSRPFRGLKTFTKEQLLECIKKHLNRGKLRINTYGIIVPDTSAPFRTTKNELYINFTKDLSFRDIKPFTMYSLDDFKETKHYVTGVPYDSYNFYMVLSEIGNFYISKTNFKSIDANITRKFDKKFVFDGFLRVSENGKEYHIIDILYYEGQNLSGKTFEERNNLIRETSYFYLNDLGVTDDVIVFPIHFNNIIYGSHQILSEGGKHLIFIPNDSFNYTIWKEHSNINTVELQILNKRANGIINLGYNNSELPEKVNLEQLKTYKSVPKIPDSVEVGKYSVWRINRDSNGNLVPNRFLTFIRVIDKSQVEYDDAIRKIEISLRPVSMSFFSNISEWNTPTETLVDDNGLLINV